MRYGSVCSGIEAATSAWHSLGWTPQWFSEIEPFPSAVLAHHYPNVPNFGDMTKFKEWKLDDSTAIDVLVGGTPCQSFSVAGLRKGLDDPRGNLMLVYLAIAAKYQPKWLVWENVPGVLSSSGGEDFASLLRGMGELGYGFAYRILDAQYFGVAQRRRRVFVVANARSWQRAAAVLFERESLSGNPAPKRAARKDVAACIGASPASSSSPNVGNGQGNIITGTLTARMGHNPMGAPEVDGGFYIPWPAEVAPTLNCAYADKQGLEDQHALHGAGLFVPTVAHATIVQPIGLDEEQNARVDGFGTLKARMEGGGFQGTVMTPAMQVRRLTPRECERLQGFPDDYTLIPYRNKPASDGPRYKALGNSMAVPVMAWIGKRIQMVADLESDGADKDTAA